MQDGFHRAVAQCPGFRQTLSGVSEQRGGPCVLPALTAVSSVFGICESDSFKTKRKTPKPRLNKGREKKKTKPRGIILLNTRLDLVEQGELVDLAGEVVLLDFTLCVH